MPKEKWNGKKVQDELLSEITYIPKGNGRTSMKKKFLFHFAIILLIPTCMPTFTFKF